MARFMSTKPEIATSGRKRSTRRSNAAPTITDVAREAQCSPMTVSRVINGEENVREDTKQKVLGAIAKLNYVPNRAARSLAAGSQLRIALLFDNPSASYLSEFLMGALEEASRRDIYLVVQSCETVSEAAGVIRKLLDGGIEGFILPPPLCDDQNVLDQIRAAGGIAVAVLIDEFQAAYDMTRHIIGLGHERIGFIIGNPEQVASGQRLEGYRSAMTDAGLAIDEGLIAQGQFTYRSGMVAAEKLLGAAKPPTAIFASNDDMAAATVAMAHRRHLDVPNDITVCGFDDTELASSIWPELTTIRQPIREMTAEAVGMIARVHKQKPRAARAKAEQLTLAYQLIRRNSDAGPSLAASFNKPPPVST
jgi:LacI family transcriptional regulator